MEECILFLKRQIQIQKTCRYILVFDLGEAFLNNYRNWIIYPGNFDQSIFQFLVYFWGFFLYIIIFVIFFCTLIRNDLEILYPHLNVEYFICVNIMIGVFEWHDLLTWISAFNQLSGFVIISLKVVAYQLVQIERSTKIFSLINLMRSLYFGLFLDYSKSQQVVNYFIFFKTMNMGQVITSFLKCTIRYA